MIKMCSSLTSGNQQQKMYLKQSGSLIFKYRSPFEDQSKEKYSVG